MLIHGVLSARGQNSVMAVPNALVSVGYVSNGDHKKSAHFYLAPTDVTKRDSTTSSTTPSSKTQTSLPMPNDIFVTQKLKMAIRIYEFM